MIPRILVVDRNEAFATMLKEMLEAEGGYEVSVTRKGSEALALLQDERFALTIIDMDLDPDDLDYRDLIPRVREVQPAVRLMLIPLMGESLPSEVHRLDIQGILSKPFFADDLLPGIEEALNKQVSLATPPPAPAPTSSPTAPPVPAEIEAILLELAREIYADVVLLVSTRGGGERIIAHVSSLDQTQVAALAHSSTAAVRAAQATARCLGQSDRPFEHNMFEADSWRLYVLSVPKDMLLAAVTPTSAPLGTIRHNLRRAARQLAQLASAG